MSTTTLTGPITLPYGLTAAIYRDRAAADRRRRIYAPPPDNSKSQEYQDWLHDNKVSDPCCCAKCYTLPSYKSPSGGKSA